MSSLQSTRPRRRWPSTNWLCREERRCDRQSRGMMCTRWSLGRRGTPVQCVQALGAIFKPNGSIRPITDCKRPIGLSINNSMHKTCYTFSYSNINSVCSFVQPGDYLCVVDIPNAYRSVNIFPSHVYFQVYLNHCLSFGLKSQLLF